MKKIVYCVIAASFVTGIANAQTATVETITTSTETAEVIVAQDYSFDLDRTSDPSLAPLPADAGDYEIASPSEVQTISSITFDLE